MDLPPIYIESFNYLLFELILFIKLHNIICNLYIFFHISQTSLAAYTYTRTHA